MKKILSNNSLKNKTLKSRNDLSPLLKTYVHRFNNFCDEHNKKWWQMLSENEKTEIESFYGKSYFRKFDKTKVPVV